MVYSIEIKDGLHILPVDIWMETNYPEDGFYKVTDGTNEQLVQVGTDPTMGKTAVRSVMICSSWAQFIAAKGTTTGFAEEWPGEGTPVTVNYKMVNSVSEEFVLTMLDKVIEGINGKKPAARK